MSEKCITFAANLKNTTIMTSPKTIARRLRAKLYDALANGKEEVFFTDENNHELVAVYHSENEEQPWFINEYIEWKDGHFWTEYAQLIENEL